MSTRIQLRGISRTPSDKMSADGGLAESLNFRIVNDECAPMIPPKDLTADADAFSKYGLPPVSAGEDYDVLYVHKQNNYENYICSQPSALGGTNVGIWKVANSNYSLDSFVRIPQGETIKEVTALGNTLIIYTDKNPYVVIYKDGGYEYLGSRIPSPAIRINGYGNGHTRADVKSNAQYWNSRGSNYAEGWSWIRLGHDYSNPLPDADIESMVKGYKINIQSETKSLLDTAASNGLISAPVFMRTAVRLFDNTFVNQSAPYCVGAGQNYSMDIWVYEEAYVDEEAPETEEFKYAYFLCFRINPSGPKVFLNNVTEIEKWGDIIRSIDVFASEEVINPVIATTGTPTEVSSIGDAEEISEIERSWDVFMEGQLVSLSQIEELAVSRNVFGLVLTASQNQSIYDEDYGTTWAAMASGDGVAIPYPSGKVLATRDVLPDDYDSNFSTIAENATVFNQRLILSGVRQLLSGGNTWLGSPVSSNYMNGSYSSFKFKYFVTASSGDIIDNVISGGDSSTVLGKSYDGTDTFTPAVISQYHREECFGWLAYPHPNCKKVIVRTTNGQTKFVELEMKQHPKLSCSYVFLGFGAQLGDQDPMIGMTDVAFNSVNPYLSYLNKMFYSEVGNPFVFPVANRQTFDEEVLACAVANRALSQGQFGQYPLYVFTKGGIYSMATTAVGTFASVVPLSRDVALSAEAIKSIDRAVVFTTAKGVMLLSGSEVTCLSTEMNGQHYTIDPEVMLILNQDDTWNEFVPLLTDTTPFMEFMANVRYAYDYAGGRLLCFNPSKAYAYVYMSASSTWHKISLPAGVEYDAMLNSYPETLISFNEQDSIWQIAAIPADATKRGVVAGIIKDWVETDYSAQQISDILSSGPFRFNDSDVINADALEGELYDAQAVYEKLQATHLMDYSTYLDSENTEWNYGVMVTRPIDLDAPDVRKVIKDLRLRGQHVAGNVRYILLGSMDGKDFGVLNSLRGTSCKSFRFVILSKMRQAERISYLEIEYGERFRNRLR